MEVPFCFPNYIILCDMYIPHSVGMLIYVSLSHRNYVIHSSSRPLPAEEFVENIFKIELEIKKSCGHFKWG